MLGYSHNSPVIRINRRQQEIHHISYWQYSFEWPYYLLDCRLLHIQNHNYLMHMFRTGTQTP